MSKFSDRQKELQSDRETKTVQDLTKRNFHLLYVPPTMVGSERFCAEWNNIVREESNRLGIKLKTRK
jgi:hypothetical protein